jgi:hypothetical protein
MVYSALSRLSWILRIGLFAAAPVLGGLQVNRCLSRIHDSCVPAVPRLLTAVAPADGQLTLQARYCSETVRPAGCSQCQCEKANHPVVQKTAAVPAASYGDDQSPIRDVFHPLWFKQPLPNPPELDQQSFSFALNLMEKTIFLI